MLGIKIHTKTAAETRAIGAELGRILKHSGNPFKGYACVIALTGNLGAGKTTFTQGFARGLGIKRTIQSPTFVLMKRFSLTSAMRGEIPVTTLEIKRFGRLPPRKRGGFLTGFKTLYHLDCYRLESLRDLGSLKLERILKDPHALVLIEWAERAAKLLPRKRMRIQFNVRDQGRTITLT